VTSAKTPEQGAHYKTDARPSECGTWSTVYNAPDGMAPVVRSTWFIHRDGDVLRLAPAYPARRK
jgi:hypothetical protein